MKPIQHFAWLAVQASDGLVYIWPVSVALFILLGVALFIDKKNLQRADFACLYPFLGTATILTIGTVLENTGKYYYFPYAGFVFCVLLSVYVIVRLRRIWMTALTTSLFILWYSLWCGLVSVMSITGDWM